MWTIRKTIVSTLTGTTTYKTLWREVLALRTARTAWQFWTVYSARFQVSPEDKQSILIETLRPHRFFSEPTLLAGALCMDAPASLLTKVVLIIWVCTKKNWMEQDLDQWPLEPKLFKIDPSVSLEVYYLICIIFLKNLSKLEFSAQCGMFYRCENVQLFF